MIIKVFIIDLSTLFKYFCSLIFSSHVGIFEVLLKIVEMLSWLLFFRAVKMYSLWELRKPSAHLLGAGGHR